MGRGRSADATEFWNRYEQRASKDYAVSLKAKIKSSTLSSYKTEKRFPRANEAVLIAQALGTTVEELVTGKPAADLPAEFLADCRILHGAGLLESVEILARGLAANVRASQPARAPSAV